MSKYPINKDFKILSLFKAPLSETVLPVCNAYLGAIFNNVRSNKSISVSKKAFSSFDGQQIQTLLISPVGITQPAPCLLLLHGGAFVFNAGKYQFDLAKQYAFSTQCKVLFVNYRLAPKFPYPVPFEDCVACYRWAVDNADDLGIDSSRIAVGGDSAGGNLAAATALAVRDRNLPPLCGQMLIYPVIDMSMKTPSMTAFCDTPVWNSSLNKKMWAMYLPDDLDGLPYCSPAQATDFSNLPAAYVETAQFDCLRDEGRNYADSLKQAGCEVTYTNIEGAVHGFDVIQSSKIVKDCVKNRVAFLQQIFSI